MPSQTFSGKSKDDLVVVARLSGLLGEEEAQRMSRIALARFLEKAQSEAEGTTGSDTIAEADSSVSAAEPEKPVRRRVGRPRKTAAPATQQAEASTATATDSPAEKPAGAAAKTRKKTSKTAAETSADTTGEAEAAAAAPKTRAKPGPKPASRTRTAKAGTKTTAAGKTAGTRSSNAAEAKTESTDAEESAPVVIEPAPVTAVNEVEPTGEMPESIMTVTEATTAEAATPVKPAAVVETETTAAVPEAKPARAPRRGRPPKNNTLTAAVAAADKPQAPETPENVSQASVDESQAQPENAQQAALPVVSAPAEQSDTKTVAAPESGDVETSDAPAAVETATQTPRQHGQQAQAQTQRRQDMEQGKTRRPLVETGELVSGVLEIMPDGYGFLRKDNYLQGSKDIYVPPQYIRRFNLREGDLVVGPGKAQRESDRYQALLYIKEVNGLPPERMIRRPHFDKLTPIYPNEKFVLETTRNELSTRIIDLVAPIGKGQRGMIVSPPKAGKTILLQKIANAISINNPDVKLIVLLIDERPEEVTDMQRSIKGEVVYSTFDKTPENHVKVTELVLERAMRLVELKQDVVILLDSVTRMGRAYNLTINPTGRTLSGGLDPGALYGPKRFFGAARNIEDGGSLTIVATALIDTGSRMDEVIFEEFKGTGNMEVYLDRKLSEKRIFPAIDINRSGTRREELLLSTKELDAVWSIRKAFGQLDTAAVTEMIISLLMKTNNNQHFVSSINVSLNDKNVFEAMRGNRPSQNQGQNGYSG